MNRLDAYLGRYRTLSGGAQLAFEYLNFQSIWFIFVGTLAMIRPKSSFAYVVALTLPLGIFLLIVIWLRTERTAKFNTLTTENHFHILDFLFPSVEVLLLNIAWKSANQTFFQKHQSNGFSNGMIDDIGWIGFFGIILVFVVYVFWRRNFFRKGR